jgi:hypothetical protein
MFRKVSGFALWVLLGVAVALVPLACGSDTIGEDAGSLPDAMTNGG